MLPDALPLADGVVRGCCSLESLGAIAKELRDEAGGGT